MLYPDILFFSISLLITFFIYKIFGKKYAIDQPGIRKPHNIPTTQIGGIIFGPLLVIIGYYLELLPLWYILGGIISILLGAADDLFHVRWYFKLIIQLLLSTFIAYSFWGKFNVIIFYDFDIYVSQLILLFIFIIWFIGIYNAVNLLDGLDGLAGGFLFILSVGLSITQIGVFSTYNGIFAIIILSFLIFNQRPSKLFMGDAGSLFLGFHVAVLPLLYSESIHLSRSLSITPFILLSSYLIADTTRVFFTRILDKKSPMTADTIHFHHLIYQQSGSYLASIGSIYFITLFSLLISILSFNSTLTSNIMIIHLAVLLIFILTPPVQTYVPLFTKGIKPFYSWQKKRKKVEPFIPRTIFMITLLLLLLLSIFTNSNLNILIDYHHGIAAFSIALFAIINRKDIITMYVIQVSIILIFLEISWNKDIIMFSKLFTSLIFVSYFIFSIERRKGCSISSFSSLDLLVILINLGGIILSNVDSSFSFWFFLIIISLWFSIRFILGRTIYFNHIDA